MRPVRCRECRRWVRDPVWVPVGIGRVCARKLGLVLVKPRLVAASPAPARPAADGGPDQMELFELEGEED